VKKFCKAVATDCPLPSLPGVLSLGPYYKKNKHELTASSKEEFFPLPERNSGMALNHHSKKV
jgi:hypothetical protein